MEPDSSLEDLWRREAPQVLHALVRRYGHRELAEEAVQDALVASAHRWPLDGIPTNPRGWLIRVAQRGLIDALRSESARTAREERVVHTETPPAPSLEDRPAADHDDSLDLLFLCCDPSLSAGSAIALTLRSVGGLSTDEIATAFFVPSSTMGQRISRAKATIAHVKLDLDRDQPKFRNRLATVLTVLYLIFNEGYVASGGDDLVRTDLSAEAIRLTRMVHRALPDEAEVAGLLALQLLHHARRPARTRDGIPLALDEQDRSLWDTDLLAEGAALAEAALARGPVGRYQVQAAIAALHGEAATAADTDWLQILALYDLLTGLDPSPMVRVSRAVAVAGAAGARQGLDALEHAARAPELAGSRRVLAVRAHLLEQLGEREKAGASYRAAARVTRSAPERRYLLGRAARLS